MAHTREANALKVMPLSPFEREVIVACLIGDGSLMKSGKQYRLRLNHTVRHSEYVRWKYQLLQRICITEPQYIPTIAAMRMGTVGHPELTALRHKWYIDGAKRIPLDFRLTPLMIAIWLMDDGCKQGNSVDFSVHCFSETCISILRKSLADYDIATTVFNDGKGSRIYVRHKSYDSFKALVKPYMHECMTYKLP